MLQPNTTICFDFGNTRLKAAIFEDNNFVEEMVLAEDGLPSVQQLMEKYSPQKTILSSVINHNVEIESFLGAHSLFHKLSSQTKANFTTPVGKPDTIGADRLALCAAAVHFFSEKNNLVIALGSCITYNFINQYHQFLGGSISPGMEMRFKSMQVFTAKLPFVQAQWEFPLVGYDTNTNLQSGVIAGMGFELDGFINAYAEKYDNLNVVLTGGDALNFLPRLKNKIIADKDFLFKGLFALSEINNV